MALLSTGASASSVDLQQYETFEAPIKLVRNDTLPQLMFTLKDAGKAATGATLDPSDSDTWAPLDLTNCTIKLKLRAKDDTVIKEELPVFVYGGDPTKGTVFMEWTATSLDTAGEFTGEVEVTNASSQIGTVFTQLRFIVREDY